MAIEIEMKAWVFDAPAMRSRLSRVATFLHTYDKTDTYFHAPKPSIDADGDNEPLEFRIRRDGTRNVCTRKLKRVENGLEINLEHEFDVSDAGLFEQLMLSIGCRVCARKQKAGEVFRVGSLLVELTEVAGLGTFVEIEHLAEDEDSRIEVEVEIRGLLVILDVPDRLIESRRYTEMLAERDRGIFRSPTA